MRLTVCVSCLFLTVSLATLSSAQTNDGVYRFRDWNEEAVSSRVAGLAGANVTIGDYSAIAGNPAALGRLEKSEVGGDLAIRGDGAGLSSASGLGLVGGSIRLTSRWTVGGYINRPMVSTRNLGAVALGDGSTTGPGWLEEVVTMGGGGVAWTPRAGVHVGLSVSGVHLHTEGLYQDSMAGTKTLEVGIAGSNMRLISSLGIVISGERFDLGLTGRTGGTWNDIERKANSNGTTVETYPIRQPARLALGGTFRPVDRVLLVGQVDFVRYGEIQDVLAIRRGAFSREDYAVTSGTEGRLAVEFSQPVGAASVQLRGGVILRTSSQLEYVGGSADEALRFPAPEGDVLPTLGGSVVLRQGFRIDASARLSGDRSTMTVGGSYRF